MREQAVRFEFYKFSDATQDDDWKYMVDCYYYLESKHAYAIRYFIKVQGEDGWYMCDPRDNNLFPVPCYLDCSEEELFQISTVYNHLIPFELVVEMQRLIRTNGTHDQTCSCDYIIKY